MTVIPDRHIALSKLQHMVVIDRSDPLNLRQHPFETEPSNKNMNHRKAQSIAVMQQQSTRSRNHSPKSHSVQISPPPSYENNNNNNNNNINNNNNNKNSKRNKPRPTKNVKNKLKKHSKTKNSGKDDNDKLMYGKSESALPLKTREWINKQRRKGQDANITFKRVNKMPWVFDTKIIESARRTGDWVNAFGFDWSRTVDYSFSSSDINMGKKNKENYQWCVSFYASHITNVQRLEHICDTRWKDDSQTLDNIWKNTKKKMIEQYSKENKEKILMNKVRVQFNWYLHSLLSVLRMFLYISFVFWQWLHCFLIMF